MTFNLSALLNPAPSSGPPSPKSSSKEGQPESEASPATLSRDVASGKHSGTMDSNYNHHDAASTLAALAHASPPSYSAPLTSPTLDSHTQDQAQRRQSSASILPPLEPSPTVANHHSSSPTLEQYHHGSNSPEQRRQSEVEGLSTPPIKLPPLQGLPGALQTQSKAQGETPGPSNLPLFIPAQVRADRKPSTTAQHTHPSPKSTSPESMIPSVPLDVIPDPETRAAVQAAVNEHGLRAGRKPSEQKLSVEPTPSVPKKRAAPKSVAANKKGTAKKSAAPPTKKRKTEAEGPRSAGTRSATPVARQPKAGGKNRSSATPAIESSPASTKQEEDYGSEDEDVPVSEGDLDDGEVFCTCRKPDDHKYMIACDGGCEDWFHGRCVKISEEDGKLIDKYICPNCEKDGAGETTWKPMCRRPGCRKAARLTKGEVSKYCSQDCGLLFFSNLIETTADASNLKSKRKPGQKPNKHAKDPDHPASKAGPLTPGQLKALVTNLEEADTFRSLGNGVLNPLTPGLIKSFNSLIIPHPAKGDTGTNDSENFYNLTDGEQNELSIVSEKKADLRTVRTTLKDRERFISMLKERLAAYAERQKLKPKDVCGYDERLSWTLERFRHWRESPAGIAVFNRGTLDGLPNANGTLDDKVASAKSDANAMDVDTSAAAEDEPDISFCLRKRCERHKMWQKLQLEDVRFEESGLADQMRQLDRAERELKERASMRWRRDGSGLLKHQGTVEMGQGAGYELR